MPCSRLTRTVVLLILSLILPPSALRAQFGGKPARAPRPADRPVKSRGNQPPQIAEGPKTVDPATLVPKPLAANATIEFDEATLREIAEWIQKQQGIPVLLDKAALSAEGIPLGEPVSDHLKNEPIYLLLNRLGSLGLAWYVEDDILHITTEVVAAERLSTESYNVSDLLDAGYDQDAFSETIDAATTGPWQEVDGEGGVMEWLGDVLFVRNTAKVHREVNGLLTALRKHGRETFALDPPQHITIRQKLGRRISVSFEDTPLVRAIGRLAEQTEADIRLETKALREEGIRVREPVSLTLSDRSLSTILRVLLADLGLTWVLRDGVLWITTEVAAEEEFKTVVYDVRDLCRDENESAELTDAIQDQTSGPWEEVDGEGGVIQFPVPGTMVIRQTESVLREIGDLLATYRKALSESKPRKKDVLDPQAVETRYYRMSADIATDLINVLPQLVQPGTWVSDQNPAATGHILKVASGHQLLNANGQIVNSANRSAGDGKSTSGAVVVPQAVLIIRQTRESHDEIAKVITRVSQGDPPVDEKPFGGGRGGMGGGGGFGGGFFSTRH